MPWNKAVPNKRDAKGIIKPNVKFCVHFFFFALFVFFIASRL